MACDRRGVLIKRGQEVAYQDDGVMRVGRVDSVHGLEGVFIEQPDGCRVYDWSFDLLVLAEID